MKPANLDVLRAVQRKRSEDLLLLEVLVRACVRVSEREMEEGEGCMWRYNRWTHAVDHLLADRIGLF